LPSITSQELCERPLISIYGQKLPGRFPPHGDVQPLRTLPPFPEADRQLSGGGADGRETPKLRRLLRFRYSPEADITGVQKCPFAMAEGDLSWLPVEPILDIPFCLNLQILNESRA